MRSVYRHIAEQRIERGQRMVRALHAAMAEERRECPVCHRQITIKRCANSRIALLEHDDQAIGGKLCDGSWRDVQ